jgi:hypothetical protein
VTHHTGSVPETKRKADWRDEGACCGEDPELFFPTGSDGGWKLVIEQAKTVCRRCPVTDECLRFAFDEGISDGIFGGLTEKERVSVRRRAAAKKTESVEAAASIERAKKPQPKKTLRSIWNAGARPLAADHVAWHGSPTVYFEGRTYTPRQVSFILDRGRHPEGRVLPTCGVGTCLTPSHLGDEKERTRCGTRPGYEKHLRDKTTPCGPCRQANTDAAARFRNTGTSKQKAIA